MMYSAIIQSYLSNLINGCESYDVKLPNSIFVLYSIPGTIARRRLMMKN